MKIRPVGVESFHADRWTDAQTYITKRIVAFRNFANAPKKYIFSFLLVNLNYTKSYVYKAICSFLINLYILEIDHYA